MSEQRKGWVRGRVPVVVADTFGGDRELARAALQVCRARYLAEDPIPEELAEAYAALPDSVRQHYGAAGEALPNAPDHGFYTGPKDWNKFQKARQSLFIYWRDRDRWLERQAVHTRARATAQMKPYRKRSERTEKEKVVPKPAKPATWTRMVTAQRLVLIPNWRNTQRDGE